MVATITTNYTISICTTSAAQIISHPDFYPSLFSGCEPLTRLFSSRVWWLPGWPGSHHIRDRYEAPQVPSSQGTQEPSPA